MPPQAITISNNVERVRDRMARAAERARRQPSEITLVAVSKTFPAEAIREAYAAGVRHFGENRVQEWEQKRPAVADLDATWHLVGHLQSNKARRATRLFHAIDSVDDLSLARKLNDSLSELASGEPSAAKLSARKLTVQLEVRLSPEETKTGISEAGLLSLAEGVFSLPHLDLRGLMTIPPLFDDPEQVRPYFRRLRELRDDLARRIGRPLSDLSMGMSHDFEIAIEEGATQVRVGTAVFGTRTLKPGAA
jgi:PLP dependent protein